MFGKGKVKNIKKEQLTKKITIGDKETIVTIDRVFTGIVDGRKEILDEVMIDNMLDGMVGAIASNRTRYNAIPSEIIIKTNNIQAEDSLKVTEEADEPDSRTASADRWTSSTDGCFSAFPAQKTAVSGRADG